MNEELLGLSSSSLSICGYREIGQTQTQKNPLTLDELRSFSRQLLNISFVLYWRENEGDDGRYG
ncbi:hypothetical protein L208DRAFT_1233799 [Tricholoma matsutake]|nr:hypothetical protein L208DRAFT_1233799 [Tricholoma matsutake 945]